MVAASSACHARLAICDFLFFAASSNLSVSMFWEADFNFYAVQAMQHFCWLFWIAMVANGCRSPSWFSCFGGFSCRSKDGRWQGEPFAFSASSIEIWETWIPRRNLQICCEMLRNQNQVWRYKIAQAAYLKAAFLHCSFPQKRRRRRGLGSKEALGRAGHRHGGFGHARWSWWSWRNGGCSDASMLWSLCVLICVASNCHPRLRLPRAKNKLQAADTSNIIARQFSRFTSRFHEKRTLPVGGQSARQRKGKNAKLQAESAAGDETLKIWGHQHEKRIKGTCAGTFGRKIAWSRADLNFSAFLCPKRLKWTEWWSNIDCKHD